MPEEEKAPAPYKTWEIPETAHLTYPLHWCMHILYRIRNQFLLGLFYDVHAHAQVCACGGGASRSGATKQPMRRMRWGRCGLCVLHCMRTAGLFIRDPLPALC